MRSLLSDPEIVRALQNPKVMQAMMEMQMRGPLCPIACLAIVLAAPSDYYDVPHQPRPSTSRCRVYGCIRR